MKWSREYFWVEVILNWWDHVQIQQLLKLLCFIGFKLFESFEHILFRSWLIATTKLIELTFIRVVMLWQSDFTYSLIKNSEIAVMLLLLLHAGSHLWADKDIHTYTHTLTHSHKHLDKLTFLALKPSGNE